MTWNNMVLSGLQSLELGSQEMRFEGINVEGRKMHGLRRGTTPTVLDDLRLEIMGS